MISITSSTTSPAARFGIWISPLIILLSLYSGGTIVVSAAASSQQQEEDPVLTSKDDNHCSKEDPNLDARDEALKFRLPKEYWNSTDPCALKHAIRFGMKVVVPVMEAHEIGSKRFGLGRTEREQYAILQSLHALQLFDIETLLQNVFQQMNATMNIKQLEQGEEQRGHDEDLRQNEEGEEVADNKRSLSGIVTELVQKNWLYEFHDALTSVAPLINDVIFGIYTDRPSDAQVRLLVAMDHRAREMAIRRSQSKTKNSQNDSSSTQFNDRTFREEAFDPYRHRGGVANMKHQLKWSLINPVQEYTCFAVPTDEVGIAIRQHVNQMSSRIQQQNQDADPTTTIKGIVEMGAGTGYWSAYLSKVHDIDVLAYDVHPPASITYVKGESDAASPPSSSESENVYFTSVQYTDVQPGTCVDVFTQNPKLAQERVLLLVWPNNPDNVDVPQKEYFSSKALEKVPTWDYECLTAYLKANGTSVIYVGEREENVKVMDGAPPESGVTSTRAYQKLLKDQFVMTNQIDLRPRTWWTYDDVTVWVRRQQQQQQQQEEEEEEDAPTKAAAATTTETKASSTILKNNEENVLQEF